MSIIIDVFNNLLKYNKEEIFIIVDKYNQIWFKLKDILKLLGYTNLKKALYSSYIDDKNKVKYNDIKVYPSRGTSKLIHKYTIFIDESGLYKLLTNSKKQLAQKFRDDIFSNILPSIRKTGKYDIDKKSKSKLKELNHEIIQLKNNQRNIKYPEGVAIYIIKQIINKKIYYKLGRTKNLNKRLKVYNTGNANKLLYKYFCIIDDENIDKCIKTFMKNKEYIKNKEFYVTNLNNIVKILNKCDKRIKNITCGYCLKNKKLKDIMKHKCKFII